MKLINEKIFEQIMTHQSQEYVEQMTKAIEKLEGFLLVNPDLLIAHQFMMLVNKQEYLNHIKIAFTNYFKSDDSIKSDLLKIINN